MFIAWSPIWLTHPMSTSSTWPDSSPLRASTDAEHARGEVDGVDAAQRSARLAPPGRRADDVDDDGVPGHGDFLAVVRRHGCSAAR